MLITEDSAKNIALASLDTDVTALIYPVSSKLFNSILKTNDYSAAVCICRDAKISKPGLVSLLTSLFTHYLNIEKSKKSSLIPIFSELLSLLWQQYGEDLINLIPKIISEISTLETKPKLYVLVSQALSGMPFDSKNDLPIVLALSSKNPEIRKNALLQITDLNNFKSSVKSLIAKENNFEVLLTALDLPLDSYFYNTLVDKYNEIKTFAAPSAECLQKIFYCITNNTENSTNSHARIILLAYDSPLLRDLCSEAVSKAKTFYLFKNYNGQDLLLFLKQKLVTS